jgi:hypothetical protein
MTLAAAETPEPTLQPRPKPGPKPRSAAQIAASRANGARSRGPVTASGKARASRNAVRHGLLAAVDVAMPNEDPNGFRRLRNGLLADLPAGADSLTRLLVERLAGAFWRLARADRLEGEILAVAAGYAARRDSPLDWTRIDLDRYTRLRARTETGFFRLVQALERRRAAAVAEGDGNEVRAAPLAEPAPCRDPHRPGALAPLLGLDDLVRKRRRQLGLPEHDPAAPVEAAPPRPASPAPVEAGTIAAAPTPPAARARVLDPSIATAPPPGFVDPATMPEPDRPGDRRLAGEADPGRRGVPSDAIANRPNEPEPTAATSPSAAPAATGRAMPRAPSPVAPPLPTTTIARSDPCPPPFDPRIPPALRPRRRPLGLPADLTGAVRLPEPRPEPVPPRRPTAQQGPPPGRPPARALPPAPDPAALLATTRRRWAPQAPPLAAAPGVAPPVGRSPAAGPGGGGPPCAPP